MEIDDKEFQDGVSILQFFDNGKPVCKLFLLYEESFKIAAEIIGQLSYHNDIELSGNEVLLAVKTHFALEYMIYLTKKAMALNDNAEEVVVNVLDLNIEYKKIDEVVERLNRQNADNYYKLCEEYEKENKSKNEVLDFDTFNHTKYLSYLNSNIQNVFRININEIFSDSYCKEEDDHKNIIAEEYNRIPENVEVPKIIRLTDWEGPKEEWM